MRQLCNHLMRLVFLGCFLTSGSQIATAIQIVRGPYLQLKTATNLIVRWRTDLPTDSRVQFGTNASSLDRVVELNGTRTNHEVTLNDLSPYTAYFYSVGSSTGVLASGSSYRFVTAPGSSKPIR